MQMVTAAIKLKKKIFLLGRKALTNLDTIFKSISSLALNLLYGPILISIYDYWENLSFDYTDLVSKVMSLLFNMLSRFVMAFSQGASIF